MKNQNKNKKASVTPESYASLPETVKPLVAILLDARQNNDDGDSMNCGMAIDEAIEEATRAGVAPESDAFIDIRERDDNGRFKPKQIEGKPELPDQYAITNITADNEREEHLIAEIRGLRSHAEALAEALRGVQWKIQAYGSHWEPSQAEREAIAKALANWEGDSEIIDREPKREELPAFNCAGTELHR